MALEKSVKDNDHVFEQDDYKIVISKEYDSFYKHLVIEWVNGHWGKGFNIYDTAAAKGC